jgi:predicted metalloprotease with PDZ domain
MKKIVIAALTLLLAASALADPTVRRTVVVKDGKVLTSTDGKAFQELLMSGPRAYLGVSLMNLTPELREYFGVPKDAGVMVEGVEKDSPADRVGVRVGDILLSIDGTTVDSTGDLRSGLREKKDGDSARLELFRNHARQTVVAAVREREMPRVMQLEELPGIINSPEFRARVERLGGNCDELQTRIKDLETRLKELEKKLH